MTVNEVHPGMVASGFGKNNPGPVGRVTAAALGMLQRTIGVAAEQGADTAVYLSTAPELAGMTGKYLHKRVPVATSAAAQDRTQARRLWDFSLDLVDRAG